MQPSQHQFTGTNNSFVLLVHTIPASIHCLLVLAKLLTTTMSVAVTLSLPKGSLIRVKYCPDAESRSFRELWIDTTDDTNYTLGICCGPSARENSILLQDYTSSKTRTATICSKVNTMKRLSTELSTATTVLLHSIHLASGEAPANLQTEDVLNHVRLNKKALHAYIQNFKHNVAELVLEVSKRNFELLGQVDPISSTVTQQEGTNESHLPSLLYQQSTILAQHCSVLERCK